MPGHASSFPEKTRVVRRHPRITPRLRQDSGSGPQLPPSAAAHPRNPTATAAGKATFVHKPTCVSAPAPAFARWAVTAGASTPGPSSGWLPYSRRSSAGARTPEAAGARGRPRPAPPPGRHACAQLRCSREAGRPLAPAREALGGAWAERLVRCPPGFNRGAATTCEVKQTASLSKVHELPFPVLELHPPRKCTPLFIHRYSKEHF